MQSTGEGGNRAFGKSFSRICQEPRTFILYLLISYPESSPNNNCVKRSSGPELFTGTLFLDHFSYEKNNMYLIQKAWENIGRQI